ncbi:MAG: sucrose phosphorylase [Nanoarchaeota archaeon]|nr:sucrose phosphorylase [Nanoarchaeota archaeon]
MDKTQKLSNNSIHLIVYSNSIGKNLKELKIFLDTIQESITGIHLLPPYKSYSDRGFSPISHKILEEVFGNWNDFKKISSNYQMCTDIVVNHLSSHSKEFQDVIKNGEKSKWYDLFIDFKNLGHISKEDFELIPVRKKEKPYINAKTRDGVKQFWCSFTDDQIDLNYKSQKVYDYMEDTISFLTKKGVILFRLDALGYTTKKIGTKCFLNEPEFYDILNWYYTTSKNYGASILPEVHDNVSFQRAISRRGGYGYAFALPPLVLYSLLYKNFKFLNNYLREIPQPIVTVLDTHDGICIPDVEGYLPQRELSKLIKQVQKRGTKSTLRKQQQNNQIDSVGGIYQLNCTFYEALKKDDFLYICARAIQIFSPGIPQIYYNGLLVGENDFQRVYELKDPREINRTQYFLNTALNRLELPIVENILELMKFRKNHPSFKGEYNLHTLSAHEFKVSWNYVDNFNNEEFSSSLYINLKEHKIELK